MRVFRALTSEVPTSLARVWSGLASKAPGWRARPSTKPTSAGRCSTGAPVNEEGRLVDEAIDEHSSAVDAELGEEALGHVEQVR